MAYKKNEKSNLTWIPVNVDAMGATMKRKYLAHKEAQQKAKAAREEFETAFLVESQKAGKVESGEALRYAYNYGRLVVAIVDEAETKSAKKNNEPSWF